MPDRFADRSTKRPGVAETQEGAAPAPAGPVYQNRETGFGTPARSHDQAPAPAGPVVVTPCRCGCGGLRVAEAGRELTAADVEIRLSGALEAAINGGLDRALDRALKAGGMAPAAPLADRLARRILRDTAARTLAARGLSVRAVAADLRVGVGTVQRALAPGALDRTRAQIRRLNALGYRSPRATLTAVREALAVVDARRNARAAFRQAVAGAAAPGEAAP